MGLYSLLHTDPVVLCGPDWEVFDPSSAVWSVLDAISNRRAYLLVEPTWALQGWSGDRQANGIAALSERFEHLHVTISCPSASEAGIARRRDLPVLHCSTAAFIHEDVFVPRPSGESSFAAIYDAQWIDYKRHDLAGGIGSLALIAHHPAIPTNGSVEYFRRAHAAVRHATWILSPWTATGKRWLSYQEVNAAYNRARVGLCLSRIEGHMYASMQYLLCGLPVVTTPNLGGRDEFFDPAYVRWVDADPDAVADAVDELVALELDPQMIREATLEKAERHRARLQAWMQELILAEGGAPGRWAGEAPRRLPNKLRESWSRSADVVAEISAGSSRPASRWRRR